MFPRGLARRRFIPRKRRWPPVGDDDTCWEEGEAVGKSSRGNQDLRWDLRRPNDHLEEKNICVMKRGKLFPRDILQWCKSKEISTYDISQFLQLPIVQNLVYSRLIQWQADQVTWYQVYFVHFYVHSGNIYNLEIDFTAYTILYCCFYCWSVRSILLLK